MDIKNEIVYRNEILSRARNGERISSDERLWLSTHRLFNRLLGDPYLNVDIIHLQQNIDYCIRVKIETMAYPYRILPVITVPGGKGRITPNKLMDNNLQGVSKKDVKMLGVLLNSKHDETEIIYRSALGLMGISFECDYYDDKQHIMVRKDSNTGDPQFAMVREIISKNKIVYKCKMPMTDSFENFVFSIESNGRDLLSNSTPFDSNL